jgi:protein-S-isoprenylcysteine O-methyltransferase Ste14
VASLRRSVAASVLFTVFGGPGFLLVLLPWWMTRWRLPVPEPAGRVWIAAALIEAGTAPLIESIVRFIVKGRGALVPAVPTQHLVVSGLYRHVRNPMYLGVFSILAGESVLFWSFDVVTELAVVAAGAFVFVLLYEEPTLRRSFGEEYQRYCTYVPRWIPRFTGCGKTRPSSRKGRKPSLSG